MGWSSTCILKKKEEEQQPVEIESQEEENMEDSFIDRESCMESF